MKASSFAAFLFYEWLDLKVDARNEFLSARLARGRDDVIEGDEQEVGPADSYWVCLCLRGRMVTVGVCLSPPFIVHTM